MSDSENRLFQYADLLKSIKLLRNTKQSQISEIAGCTEVHLSNVANEKAVFSTEKMLRLLNEYDICMDDFVADKYKVPVNVKYEQKQMFGRLSDDEILLILEIIKKRYLGRKEENLEFSEELVYGKNQDKRQKNKTIGRKIKEIREHRHITMEDMAESLSIQIDTYRNIESGTGTAYDNYVMIAKKLEVPVSILFEDFIRNKKAVINYEISELFDSITPGERQAAMEMIGKFVEVLDGEEEN